MANLAAGSLGRLISSMTPLVMVPLMIRTWGLHEYGEWLILSAIPTYLMLSPDFGLAGAVVNQMAISTTRGDRGEAICLYRTTWIYLTMMGLLFALTGALVGHWLNWKRLGVDGLAPQAPSIIALACLQIFLVQQSTLIGGIYRSARQNARFGLIGSAGGVFNLTLAIGILVFRGSPVAYVAANVAARAVFVGVFLFDSRRIMPDFTLGLEGVSVRTIRPYIVPGLGHATMPLVNALQNEGMLLVLGALLGPVSVAIFQTTRTAVNGAKSLMSLTATAVMMEIPALVGEGRMSSVRRLLVLNTQAALLAAFFWFLMLAFFGEFIFNLWLHHAGVFSQMLAMTMAASLFPFALGNSFGLLLLATNKIHRAVPILAPVALLSLSVTALGGHLFGVNGAAIGMVVFESLSLVVLGGVAAGCTQVGVLGVIRDVVSKRTMRASCQSALSVFRARSIPT